MADLYEPDYGKVFYRSKDPIKNLNIRVTIERVTSATMVPLADFNQSSDAASKERKQQQQMASQKEHEEYTFTWQEKVFCQREFDYYLVEDNCTDVIEQKYHRDVIAMRDKGRPTRRLFSYVSHDSFSNAEKIERMTTSPNETPTVLAQTVAQVRRRKTNAVKRDVDSFVIPKTHIVDLNPTKETVKKNHVILTPEQVMYIMADLSPKGGAKTEDYEFVLCTIKADSNGVVSIAPDFNKGKKPYRIETTTLGREVFEFTINDASKPISNVEQEREVKMFKELYQRRADYLTSLAGHEFEMPPAGVLRLFLLGEILSAKDFEYDHLFVRYVVDFPKNWKVDYANQVSGVTQTCKTKVEGRDSVAYFSFPFELEMFYKAPIAEENPDVQVIPAWPKIYFEVSSMDTWHRYRPEGYCYSMLPVKSGEHVLKLNCWRPLGASHVSNMRRFFIGGSPELEDMSYVATPAAFEGSRLSKLGLRTEATGSIEVKLQVILQSQAFINHTNQKKKSDALLAVVGSALDFSHIRGVLDAFHKAHERMKLARSNVIRDLKDLQFMSTGDSGVLQSENAVETLEGSM